MKIIKIRLCNKIEDEFFFNSLITYIKKNIVKLFDNNSIIYVFNLKKEHRVQLRMPSFSRSKIMIDHNFVF